MQGWGVEPPAKFSTPGCVLHLSSRPSLYPAAHTGLENGFEKPTLMASKKLG